MKYKTYTIATMQDIFDIIKEDNINAFMLDFYKMIHTNVLARKEIGEEDWVKLRMPSFEWKDDGKSDLSFKFEVYNTRNMI